ncbi:MAG: branched-chain-amino-acid transaminase [Nitrospirae bacterium]|nr:branched-chain-amino-acid transaminase [Nitrospirota bacterium]
MLIFVNGSLVPEDEAKVSVLDRGFLYGDGVFETLRAYSGKIFRLSDHLNRLFCSANALRLKTPFTENYLEEALYQTLRGNNHTDAYLRLTITRGVSAPGLDTEGCLNPTLTIVSREFSGYPDDLYSSGIKAAVVSTRRIPPEALNPEIKSLNFLNNIMARMEAREAGASEAFMLSTEGYVAEGTVSNIFIVKEGAVKTAPTSVGILNGVTRSLVIGIAQENNIPLSEQPFQPDELYYADECFVTSTLYEVMPVTSINNKLVGTGFPGMLTQTLLDLFQKIK